MASTRWRTVKRRRLDMDFGMDDLWDDTEWLTPDELEEQRLQKEEDEFIANSYLW